MYRKQWVGLGKREDATHFQQNIDNIAVVSFGLAVSLAGSGPHLWVHAEKVGFCLTYRFGVIICLIPMHTSDHPLFVATKNSIFITPVLFEHFFPLCRQSLEHHVLRYFHTVLVTWREGNGNVSANTNDEIISSGSISPRNTNLSLIPTKL
jgi:hypothetical protein